MMRTLRCFALHLPTHLRRILAPLQWWQGRGQVPCCAAPLHGSDQCAAESVHRRSTGAPPIGVGPLPGSDQYWESSQRLSSGRNRVAVQDHRDTMRTYQQGARHCF